MSRPSGTPSTTPMRKPAATRAMLHAMCVSSVWPAPPPRCAAARATSDAGRPREEPARPWRPRGRRLLLRLPSLERLLGLLEEGVVHEALREIVVALHALGGDLLRLEQRLVDDLRALRLHVRV